MTTIKSRPAVMPRYQQVKQYVLQGIQRGLWKPDDKVPSEAQLVKELGVSRMTANRALRELTEDGVLVGVAGVGRFVADHQTKGHLLEIRDIAREIAERGGVHTAQVLELKVVAASKAIAQWLEISVGEAVFYSKILHLENQIPLQLEHRYVSSRFAPNYLEIDFNQQTPHAYLTAVAPLAEAEHQVQASMPDSEVAGLLRMEQKEPCLVLFRRTWAKGLAASAAILFHPSSRYVLGDRFEAFTSSKKPKGDPL